MLSSVSSERLALVDALRTLREQCGEAPDYNQLWRLVARGDVPAERIRGRWSVNRSDLPQVAAALGIAVRSAA
jgi:hypothetical protein